MPARNPSSSRRSAPTPVAAVLLATLAAGAFAAPALEAPRTIPAAMVPMGQVGPQPRSVDLKGYAHVIRVAPDGKHPTVASALAAVKDASAKNRYVILVAAGTYNESRIRMKPHVDLYGGFAAGDWKTRDVYQQATILDAQTEGAGRDRGR